MRRPLFASLFVSCLVLLGGARFGRCAEQESVDGQPALGRIQAIREEQRARRAEVKQNLSEAQGPSESALSVTRMAKGLGFCVGVFLIGFGLTKRFRKNPAAKAGKRIAIIERVPLTPKSCLVLARVNGRDVLIGVGSENVSVTELQLEETFTEQGDTGLEILRALEVERQAVNES